MLGDRDVMVPDAALEVEQRVELDSDEAFAFELLADLPLHGPSPRERRPRLDDEEGDGARAAGRDLGSEPAAFAGAEDAEAGSGAAAIYFSDGKGAGGETSLVPEDEVIALDAGHHLHGVSGVNEIDDIVNGGGGGKVDDGGCAAAIGNAYLPAMDALFAVELSKGG